MNPNRPTPKYITIKMAMVKERGNLKSSRRKAISYLQRAPIKMSADFSTETL